MRKQSSGGPVGPLTAFTAAATTWVALLAWRGFTEDPGRFLAPLVVLGLLVAGLGSLLRWWRAPGPVVVLTQVVVAALVAAAIITGHALPVGEGWTALREAFVVANQSANDFAAPVPAGAPEVHPLLIAGGLGCLLVIDVVVCTLRRVPLAGLPLLTIYSVPVGMLGTSLPWWIFATSAAGFLLLLFLEQSERVRRWGRTLSADQSRGAGGARGAAARRGRTATGLRMHAGAIGAGVTGLAVLLPLMIPTLSLQLFDLGTASGGSGAINVVNPTTDLQRDLQQTRDVPLLTVRTDDPAPSYLRIATLNRFSRNEWSPGDREIPARQQADGAMPPLQGVSPTVSRTQYSYQLEATQGFNSDWLPTPIQTTSIEAAGDWRYDAATRDFIASGDDVDTRGLDWNLTAVDLGLDATTMARASSSLGLVGAQFTQLPDDIDPVVMNLATRVTANAASRYEKAVALQNWFRASGGFTYSLDVDLGTGEDDLVRFLTAGNGGRVGYCEQFASAMAVMARQLGIPARVAVGFLKPEQTGATTYVYSSRDLHAWPELFIPGAGWVRFEPTPPDRASTVPDYTLQGITPVDPSLPVAPGAGSDQAQPGDGASTAPGTPEDTQDTASDTTRAGSGWWPVALAVVVVALLLVLAMLPGLVRRRRRERRCGGDVELAWAELRDTATDLGLSWPTGRSPRETGDAVAPLMPEPAALAALDRLVVALERTRYARGTTETADGVVADLDLCIGALQAAATTWALRRAAVLPVSVMRRAGRDGTQVASLGDDSSSGRPLERV